jgi:hypothetical protein
MLELIKDNFQFYAERKTICTSKVGKLTELYNRLLINLQPATLNCFGRCLFFKTDSRNFESEWIPSGANKTFDCDIVDMLCFIQNT